MSYTWTDNATATGAIVDPDALNANLMHLKYDIGRTWRANFSYPANSVSLPVAFNGYQYVSSGGTSGSAEPTFPTTVGQTVVDNDITWTCQLYGTASGGSAEGFGNYIVEPFSVVPGTGLEVLINPNKCIIDRELKETTSQTSLALTAKAAQLIYKKKDNTYDKLLPAMSAADLVDANTVGLWFPDGSASVPNAAVGVNGSPAVANALAKTGTIAAVDGWAGGYGAKCDGSTGFYTAANRTGFGTSILTISGLFTYSGSGAIETIVYVGRADGYSCAGLIILASGELGIYYSGSYQLTGFIVETGKPYEFEVVFDGTNKQLKINGKLVYSFANALVLVSDVFYVGQRYDGATKSSSTIHFIDVVNAVRTPAQSAAMAQKLLIPCAYGSTDIRDAFANKAESQAVAFVIASATAPTTIIDPSNPKGTTPDWAYGIRIGPMGALNRRKFLEWQSFSGQQTKTWVNPFDSRNLRAEYYWAKDALGTNMSPVLYDNLQSGPYGVIRTGTSASPLQALTGSAGTAYFNGAFQASGYIGCYASVLES